MGISLFTFADRPQFSENGNQKITTFMILYKVQILSPFADEGYSD